MICPRRGGTICTIAFITFSADIQKRRLKRLTTVQGTDGSESSHEVQVPAQPRQQLMAAHKVVSVDDE